MNFIKYFLNGNRLLNLLVFDARKIWGFTRAIYLQEQSILAQIAKKSFQQKTVLKRVPWSENSETFLKLLAGQLQVFFKTVNYADEGCCKLVFTASQKLLCNVKSVDNSITN